MSKTSPCSPNEAALKSFFLGPQSENSDWLRQEILSILDHWYQWRQDLYPNDGKAISRDNQKSHEFLAKRQKVHQTIQELCQRFENEIPMFSPRYVGHMYSEISLPALIGHFIALLHNPNNISTEAAKVGAVIEHEAILELGKMLGFPTTATGHFTSGGTVANIEGLWRARYRMDHFLALGAYLNLHHQLKLTYSQAAHMGWDQYDDYLKKYSIDENASKKYSAVAMGPWQIFEVYRQAFGKPFQGPVVFVPNSKHYSWLKAISLLGLGDVAFQPIALNSFGVMDIEDLKKKWRQCHDEDRPVMMLVSVAGTTELGECDPIDEAQRFLDSLKVDSNCHIWHHVDAAYGGYFCSMNSFTENDGLPSLEPAVASAFKAIKHVDSVTLDPHKLGYVPYACGAFIVPDDIRYRVSAFDAKYIQSPNESVDRWMKTLEGSRSAAGATATWMTAKTMGLDHQGYGRILSRTIFARQTLQKLINEKAPELKMLESQHLNLLCLVQIGSAKKLSDVNTQTLILIDRINNEGQFVVSKTVLKKPEYQALIAHHCKSWKIEEDASELVLLRMTLMNPFFTTKETAISFPEELLKSLKI